jgi:hypothetical protein
MFISIKDTEVNQFRKAPAYLTRRAKSKHSNVWDGFSVAAIVVGVFLAITGFITFGVTMTSPPTTYDPNDWYGDYPHKDYTGVIIGFVLLFIGLFLAIAVSSILGDINDNTKFTQSKILVGFHRKYFVGPDYYSYKAVFGGPMLSALNGKDEAACRHWQATNEMFAISAVIKADKQIIEAGRGLKGIERSYKAKLVIIDAAEKLYSNEAVIKNDHFDDLRAEAERKFTRRLTAIKNKASRKLQASEELERVHATPAPTSR